MAPDRPSSDRKSDTALRGGRWLQMQEWALKPEAAIRIIRSEDVVRNSMRAGEAPGVRIVNESISSGDTAAHTTETVGGEIADGAILPGICMPCRNPWSVLMDCSGTTDDSLQSIDPPKNYQQAVLIVGGVDRKLPGTEAVADTMIDDGPGQVMTTDLAPYRILPIGKCGVMVYAPSGSEWEGSAPVETEIEERIIGPIIINGLLEEVVLEEAVEEGIAPQVKAEPGIR